MADIVNVCLKTQAQAVYILEKILHNLRHIAPEPDDVWRLDDTVSCNNFCRDAVCRSSIIKYTACSLPTKPGTDESYLCAYLTIAKEYASITTASRFYGFGIDDRLALTFVFRL